MSVLRALGRVRTSTWAVLAVFVAALITYLLVQPATTPAGATGSGTSTVAPTTGVPQTTHSRTPTATPSLRPTSTPPTPSTTTRPATTGPIAPTTTSPTSTTGTAQPTATTTSP
jgi:cytoskeletal protein RodZ